MHGWSREVRLPGASSVLLMMLLTSTGSASVCVPGPIASDRRGPATSIVVRNDSGYLGNGAALEAIDVSDPWRPARRGRVDLIDELLALRLAGSTIVAQTERSLTLVSVLAPGTPVAVGSFALPETWVTQRIAAASDHVFVATREAGLRILDISDPLAIVEIGSYSTVRAHDVVLRGDRAYLASDDGITVLDVSNPTQPIPTGLLPAIWGGLALSPSGTRLAVFGGGCAPRTDCGWLYLVDISSPDQPIQRSRTEFADSIADVEFANGLAYLVESNGPGWILNVDDLSDPRIVGGFEATRPSQLALSPPFVYVADARRGLRIFRSLAPDETTEIAVVKTPGATIGGFLRGGIATTMHDRGLRIFDLSDPRHPSLLGARWPGVESLSDIESSASHAYVASYGQGVRVYDLANPAAPQTIAVFGPRYAYALALDGDRLLVNGVLDGGAQLYDVTNPAQPAPQGLVAPLETPTDVTLVGDVAITLQRFVVGSLATHDVSDPLAPVRLSIVEGVFAGTSHAFGRRAIYTQLEGFTILDLSNPAAPVPLGSFAGIERGNSVATYGTRAYFAAADSRGNGWLQVVDLSSPTDPVEVSTDETAGGAKGVFAGPGVAVVADGKAGITIFETCVPFADGFESGDGSAWSSSRP